MALKRMLLIPPELLEKRERQPPSVQKILKRKGHSFDKWARFRLIQDPYLKTEKKRREPIPVPIEDISTLPKIQDPYLISGRKRRDTIPTLPKIHTDERYRDPTFGVYETDDGTLKIGRSDFEYTDSHIFVDKRKFKATPGLWELLTLQHPDKNVVTEVDRKAYKAILSQSYAHRVNHSPRGKVKASKGFKYREYVSKVPWESA